jgi:hypothetical protein
MCVSTVMDARVHPGGRNEAMQETDNNSSSSAGATSGPLRIYREDGRLFVTGFGLKLEVKSEEEGRALIAELEEQGYRICY